MYERLVKKELGRFQVDAVSRADIARLHHKHRNTPYQANRVLALLSSFFTWCDKHGHRTDSINPCRHIEKFKEKSRERFLSETEMHQLGAALAWYEQEYHYLKEQPHKRNKNGITEENTVTPYVTAALRVLMLTGARQAYI